MKSINHVVLGNRVLCCSTAGVAQDSGNLGLAAGDFGYTEAGDSDGGPK